MDGRIISSRDPTKGTPTNPFLASITLSTDTQPSLPTVYGSATGVSVLPVTRSAGGTLVGSSSAEGLAGAVSWQEYQRVCTNERTLTENVETLKALVLQLAAQLSQAQEELQLLEQSINSPQHVQRSRASQETPHISPETEVAAAASKEAARQELVDIIARKDRTIDALQQRMARQSTQFNMELDELARTKDAVIERLAVELDTLRCFK